MLSKPERALHGDGLCHISRCALAGCCGWPGRGSAPHTCCRHTYQSDGSLVISHVKPEDAGTYTCLTSDGRTESRQIQLQITGELSSAPDWRGSSGQLMVIDHRLNKASCRSKLPLLPRGSVEAAGLLLVLPRDKALGLKYFLPCRATP